MTYSELQDRTLLRRRLLHLAVACVIVLCVVALAACGPADSVAESSVAVSGETSTTVRVRIAALDGGPVVFPTSVPTTTTVVPAATVAPAPTVPPPSEPPSPTTTVPVALTAPASAPGGGCGGWDGLVASLWPAEQVATACRILACESGGNPRAYNPSGASGLFQIMPLWAEDFGRVTGQPYYDGRFDPYANATFARWLWGESGWQPWSCR